MGFFDRLKKIGQDPLLEELAAAHQLQNKPTGCDWIPGDWREGHYGARRLAVMPVSNKLFVFLGEPEEETEIYLSAVGPEPAAVPPDAKLAEIVGREGLELARRFELGATPPEPFDYPQLRRPAFRDGLPRLSPAVEDVCIFSRGLELIYRRDRATAALIAADLLLAERMVKALESPGDR